MCKGFEHKHRWSKKGHGGGLDFKAIVRILAFVLKELGSHWRIMKIRVSDLTFNFSHNQKKWCCLEHRLRVQLECIRREMVEVGTMVIARKWHQARFRVQCEDRPVGFAD